ncbi:hypothetical protein CPB86DRAFT_784868, partial [Serendipita vermifera]
VTTQVPKNKGRLLALYVARGKCSLSQEETAFYPCAMDLMKNSRERQIRLYFWSTAGESFDLVTVLDVLRGFSNLTWVDCGVGVRNTSPGHISPIVLPNLQVFVYKNGGSWAHILSHLVLPSLQCLYISISLPVPRLPIVDILSLYRQTIRSVVIQSHTRPKETYPLIFPPWNEFPKLEELTIDTSWSVYFKPLPSHHPLRRLNTLVGSFDVIPSFMDGVQFQELVFS